MADLLKFKHGLQADMKENSPALAAGTIYITRDERAMYVDLPAYSKDGVTEAVKRIRIGDMRVYEYLDELKTDLTNDMSALTTSALYYAEKDNVTNKKVINALLKWNGTEFIQLNKTSDIVGNLDALTARVTAAEGTIASYTTTLEDHAERIGTLEATVSALDETYATDEVLNSAIDTLNTAIGKKANQDAFEVLSQTVADNKSDADTAFESFVRDYVKKTEAPGYTDILTTTSASETYATKTELNTTKTDLIGKDSDATTADTIWAAKKMATAAQNTADAIQTQADKGVADAKTAQDTIDGYITSNNAALQAEIGRATAAEEANQAAIEALEETHGNDKQALSAAIAAEQTRAEGVESDHEERIDRIEIFFASADPGASEQLVDTLKELQEYITSDTTGAAAMAANIQTNTTDISGLTTRMTTAESNITTLQSGLASETTSREAAVTGAINTAKAYTNSALEWGTF